MYRSSGNRRAARALFTLLASFAVIVAVTVCTPAQRDLAHTVVDVADAVCGKSDPLDVCLRKMQARAAEMPDGGGGGAGGAGE